MCDAYQGATVHSTGERKMPDLVGYWLRQRDGARARDGAIKQHLTAVDKAGWEVCLEADTAVSFPTTGCHTASLDNGDDRDHMAGNMRAHAPEQHDSGRNGSKVHRRL